MKLHNLLKYSAVFAIALTCLYSSASAEGDIMVMVDNTAIEFDQPPVIMDNRTLVPVRAVFEKAGAEVEWVQDTQTAMIKKDNYSVSIKLGDAFITKNGTPVPIDVPSAVVNNRILIPVRAIAEAMDFGVTWNPVYSSVLISTDGTPYRGNAQWKTGFKTLKEQGFYIEASVSNVKFDLNNDGEDESITFTQATDETPASLIINGNDFSAIMNEKCESPFGFGVVDVIESDRYKEIIIVNSGYATVSANFYRFNGFDLFELSQSRPELSGIEFNETLFFDGVENIVSDLDGLCFLDTMVCPGMYSLEEDVINRYSLDYKKTIGMTFSKKHSDSIAFNIYYTNDYEPKSYIGKEIKDASYVMPNNLPGSFKILDTYMDSTNPSNFEFYVEFADGRKAVIWPYSA